MPGPLFDLRIFDPVIFDAPPEKVQVVILAKVAPPSVVSYQEASAVIVVAPGGNSAVAAKANVGVSVRTGGIGVKTG